MVAYQAIVWLGWRCHAADDPRGAAGGRRALRRPPGVRRGWTTIFRSSSCSPGARGARGLDSLRPGPGDRVVVWGPNSVEWVVAALAVTYADGMLVPVNSRYTGTRRPTSSTVAGRSSVFVEDGFLGRHQFDELLAASDLPSVEPSSRAHARDRAAVDLSVLQDRRHRGRDRRGGRGARGHGLSRRRGRHPVHLRHHRPVQGRDERAPADGRRRRAVGRARRGRRRGPLPGGQPVLPLLRLQGRDRHRAADRGDHLPVGDVRRRRDHGAGRAGADHRAPRRPDDLPVAADGPRARRARPVLAAAGRDRRGRRTGGADRADARGAPGGAGHRPRRHGVRDDRVRRGDDVPARTTPPSSSRPPAGGRSRASRPGSASGASCCCAGTT